MLQQIFAPIQSEVDTFNHSLDEITYHEDSVIEELLSGISLYKGKQLRPAMVFLSAAITGNITPLTYTAALVFELLHYSSLIHDDVIDDGQKRHNQPTLNAVRGSKTAVLTGDYLLSKCIVLIAQSKNIPLLEKASKVAQTMAFGELLQLRIVPSGYFPSEEQYLQIVNCKTASLISACFEMGATSSQANINIGKQWGNFGRELGIIFQLKDDLLDYQQDGFSQKDAHKDIYEHKMTFPILAALQQTSSQEKLALLYLYKNHQGKQEEIELLIEKITQYGGISYTEKVIAEKFAICATFVHAQKDSIYKDALLALIQFIKERRF